ncbi:hypothetical protein MKY41_04930 [Sporosarcina sp. FSL W7-1349]|uniref:hypothetical protein n=1 Tax=Sporosarcina sp. FSL W7-1349 TaxID=2921561 RepID=UPI0030F84117
MKILHVEIRKLLSFKEVYVALFICLGMLTLFFFADRMPDPNFTFWLSIHDFMPRMGFWFVAVMIVVGISRMIPYERETGIEELQKTYKHGTTKLLLAKLYTVFIYCVLVVTFFYLVALVVYGSIYPIEGYNLPMVESYHTNRWLQFHNPHIDVFTRWQYVLYEYGYMVFASFVFGLFVIVVSLLTKRSVWVMAICGGYFALFELYAKLLSSIHLGELFYWVFHFPANLLYTYGYNGILGFKYMVSVELPNYWMICVSLFIPITVQIILIISIYRRKTKW